MQISLDKLTSKWIEENKGARKEWCDIEEV